MSRTARQFVCQSCGAVHRKWMGQCEGCGAWNSIVEEAALEAAPKGLRQKGRALELKTLATEEPPPPRLPTGIGELDRVFGGGLVPGSAILVGGDPGVGKSTLALQTVAALAGQGAVCVYLSGEEAIDQVRLRARRLGLGQSAASLLAATNVGDAIATLEAAGRVDLVVVDSIQTMYLDSLDAAPGTVGQVRSSAYELIRFAKRSGAVLVLVGHVTKEGLIAGPRVLEHMVDTVLYFEGERGLQFRVLRAVKNRFGATDEIGVFEMTDRGLVEVANPSALFIGQRDPSVTGAVVLAGMEGTRPLLVEVQALVAPTSLATPRRAVVGWDGARLAMVLAVLDARCGLALGGSDVYLNIAGGLRIGEPAADLAVATALISSRLNVPVSPTTVAFGEIGLAGEVRPVSQMDARLREAAKLGFRRALVPALTEGRAPRADDLRIDSIAKLADLVDRVRDATARGSGRQRQAG